MNQEACCSSFMLHRFEAAAAVLEEKAGKWFVGAEVSPFMLFVHPLQPDKAKYISAVRHMNGTARPDGQSPLVSKWNGASLRSPARTSTVFLMLTKWPSRLASARSV